jgi:hypothetical protein
MGVFAISEIQTLNAGMVNKPAVDGCWEYFNLT